MPVLILCPLRSLCAAGDVAHVRERYRKKRSAQTRHRGTSDKMLTVAWNNVSIGIAVSTDRLSRSASVPPLRLR